MSFAYHKFSEYALSGALNWTTGTFVSAALIADTHTPDPTDVFLSDIPSADRPRAKTVLGGRALVDGSADSFDITFAKVPNAGLNYIGIVLFLDTAIESTSKLLVFHDSGTGWPVTPNGGNITVQVDSGVNRLFRIGS
jgi:hypothetical protein